MERKEVRGQELSNLLKARVSGSTPKSVRWLFVYLQKSRAILQQRAALGSANLNIGATAAKGSFGLSECKHWRHRAVAE